MGGITTERYEYIKWYVNEDNFPLLFYEVDTENDRYATRMTEVYPDGKIINVTENSEFVTEAPVPTVNLINADKDFYAEHITKEEFEEIYKSSFYTEDISFPKQVIS